MIQPLLLVLITLVIMEFTVAQFHRYFMHGIGWAWHKSHHASHMPIRYTGNSRKKFTFANVSFEKNDLYALFFTGVTLLLFVLSTQQSALWWIAVGISLYGFLYALMHDILVHRRLPLHWQPRNAYLNRLIKAHRLHHAVRNRDNAVSFGFLYAPPLKTLHAQLRATTKAKAITKASLSAQPYRQPPRLPHSGIPADVHESSHESIKAQYGE